MAIKKYDLLEAGPNFQKIVWRDLSMDDEGAAFDAYANASGSGYSSFTVQVEGVLEGATVEIAGSIIPDAFNVTASFAVSDIKQVPPVDMLKPLVVGGSRDTKVSIGLLATR